MKKIIICFITVLCFFEISSAKNNPLLQKLVTSNTKKPTTELDSVIITKWRGNKFKNFSVHKKRFEDIKFYSKPKRKQDFVLINANKYYIGEFIPANTKKMQNFSKVKAYTLFNVLYYIEKDPWKEILTMGFSTLGFVLPAVGMGVSYHNYDNETSSSGAKKWKNATYGSFGVSVIGAGNLVYQIYKLYIK